MGYWSIACHSQGHVLVPEAKVILEPGTNVFTVVTDDLDELLARLDRDGVSLKALHSLDQHEAIDAPAALTSSEGPGLLPEAL